jgi:CelD/BcsL family acetyltransferase involved in cellulose biosynthesis
MAIHPLTLAPIYQDETIRKLSLLMNKNQPRLGDRLQIMPTEYREISVINQLSDFAAMRDEWNQLNQRSEKGTIFSSWEWLYSWWEIYQDQGDRELFILSLRKDGELIALAPFQILNHPKKYFPCSKQLILIGTGETDGGLVLSEYLDLIIEPGAVSHAVSAFTNYLMDKQSQWQGSLFQQLLDDSYLSLLFGGQNLSIQAESKPNGFRTLIDLPETYKDYLMSLQKKKRNNITRMLTRLQKEQDYVVDNLSDGLDPDKAITELADLNRERRENLQQPSAFHQPNFEAFHRLVVKRLLPTNQVQIRILRIEGKPVAALYTLIDGDTMHAYQSGFEAELGHRYALLTMMITQEISHCIDDPRLKRFNFMYSADENSYKLRYSAYTEPMFDQSYFPKNVRTSLHNLVHGPVKQTIKQILKKNAA